MSLGGADMPLNAPSPWPTAGLPAFSRKPFPARSTNRGAGPVPTPRRAPNPFVDVQAADAFDPSMNSYRPIALWSIFRPVTASVSASTHGQPSRNVRKMLLKTVFPDAWLPSRRGALPSAAVMTVLLTTTSPVDP